MEPLYPWLMLIAGLLVGALIGGAVMMTMERRSRGSEHDVRQVRRELDDYRNEVAEHYAETAKRVNGLTHAYKDVYDHLERGAYKLVGEPELRRRLDDAEPRPVTLEGIGGRGLQRPREERESTAAERTGREEADGRSEDTATAGAGTAGLGAASARSARAGTGDERPAATSAAPGTASRTTGTSRTVSAEEAEGDGRTSSGADSTTDATDDEGAAVSSARDGTAYRHALGAEDDETTDGEPRVYRRKETEAAEGEDRSGETTERRA